MNPNGYPARLEELKLCHREGEPIRAPLVRPLLVWPASTIVYFAENHGITITIHAIEKSILFGTFSVDIEASLYQFRLYSTTRNTLITPGLLVYKFRQIIRNRRRYHLDGVIGKNKV